MNQAEIDQLIEAELRDWAAEVLRVLAFQIQKRNLVLTGDLLRSLQYDVLRAAAEGTMRLRLMFEEAGRIKDMKNVRYKKLPPISKLEEYVKEIGLANFKYVPGYTKGRIPTESQAINRIAWGIATSKRRKNRQVPKKWFAKPFYSMLTPLIRSITDVYIRAASQSITDNIQP
jgi:hypothetical protein